MYIRAKGSKEIPIRVLLDGGSDTLVISDKIAKQFPGYLVNRAIPRIITTFLGKIEPNAGKQLVINVTLRYKTYYFIKTFEVNPTDPDCDVILPFA